MILSVTHAENRYCVQDVINRAAAAASFGLVRSLGGGVSKVVDSLRDMIRFVTHSESRYLHDVIRSIGDSSSITAVFGVIATEALQRRQFWQYTVLLEDLLRSRTVLIPMRQPPLFCFAQANRRFPTPRANSLR
jgi:hypothetical protein